MKELALQRQAITALQKALGAEKVMSIALAKQLTEHQNAVEIARQVEAQANKVKLSVDEIRALSSYAVTHPLGYLKAQMQKPHFVQGDERTQYQRMLGDYDKYLAARHELQTARDLVESLLWLRKASTPENAVKVYQFLEQNGFDKSGGVLTDIYAELVGAVDNQAVHDAAERAFISVNHRIGKGLGAPWAEYEAYISGHKKQAPEGITAFGDHSQDVEPVAFAREAVPIRLLDLPRAQCWQGKEEMDVERAAKGSAYQPTYVYTPAAKPGVKSPVKHYYVFADQKQPSSAAHMIVVETIELKRGEKVQGIYPGTQAECVIVPKDHQGDRALGVTYVVFKEQGKALADRSQGGATLEAQSGNYVAHVTLDSDARVALWSAQAQMNDERILDAERALKKQEAMGGGAHSCTSCVSTGCGGRVDGDTKGEAVQRLQQQAQQRVAGAGRGK